MDINWEASLTAKHKALEVLAYLVTEEFGEVPIPEIAGTWGPLGITDSEVELIREVFPGPVES